MQSILNNRIAARSRSKYPEYFSFRLDVCPFKSIVLRYVRDAPGMSCVVRDHPTVKILSRNSCVVYKIAAWLCNRVEISTPKILKVCRNCNNVKKIMDIYV